MSIFEWTLARDVSLDGKTLLLAETGDATGADYATYLRTTDGSPPIRLGIGVAQSLSPSGRWALARSADNSKLFLYPTGAGQAKTFEHEGIEAYGPSQLLDDDTAVVTAREIDGDPRPHLLDLSTGQLTPLAEGPSWVGPTSPDGQSFVLFSQQSTQLVSIGDRDTRDIQGLLENERVLQWTAAGTGLYVVPEMNILPLQVFLLDLATGQRTFHLEVEPIDRAGAGSITSMRINPAGTAYAYSHSRIFSELHLVEGLE